MSDQAKPYWGKESYDLPEHWPAAADGTPERPVFLTGSTEVGGETDLLVEMLRSYGIPVLKDYGRGMSGKIILGFSGYGADLYVPESRLEDAHNLIQPIDETEETQ